MSLNEFFHEHGRHAVLLGMTGRVKQVVTTSWQGQQPDAAPVNRGTLHGDGLIDKEQLTNQLSQDKKSELGMSKTNTSEGGTEGRPIHANMGGQAVGTPFAVGSEQQNSPSAQHVQTTDQILEAFLELKLKGKELETGLMEKLEQYSLVDLQKLAAVASVNPDLEKSELARNICVTYCMLVDSGGEDEEGSHVCSEIEPSDGRDDKREASYESTHGSKRSDVGEEYSALAAIAGGQSKGAGTKVRLPSLCSRKKQLRCMAIRQMPRCGFACVVIISRAAQSAVARCPVCQCACMRNPLTSGSIPVAIHLCNSSCFLDCMACYHKKTVAVSEENNMKRWPVGGKLQLEEGCCI